METASAKLERFSEPVPMAGCFLWQGAVLPNGYGVLRWKGETVYAHRLAYAEQVGPLVDGLTIDHLCRVRCCVNPQHLEQVSRGENVRRGVRPAPRTHCFNGHEFTDDNTYVTPSTGHRRCRTCRLDHQRRSRR